MNPFQQRFRRIVQLAVAMTIVCAVFSLIPSVRVYDDTSRLIETRSAFGWQAVGLLLLIPAPAVVFYRSPRRAHTWMWLLWVVLIASLSQHAWRQWPAHSYIVDTWPAHVALWARRMVGMLILSSLVVAIISREKREDPIAKARVVD